MYSEGDDQAGEETRRGSAVESKELKLEPLMQFDAPILKRDMGAVLESIDLGEIERLAALGMKPAAIGPCIGLTVAAFRHRFQKFEQVRDAWAKGNADWTKRMLERTAKVLDMPESARNPALLIFALKQGHGPGWADEVEKTPEAVENRAAIAWEKRKVEEHTLPRVINDSEASRTMVERGGQGMGGTTSDNGDSTEGRTKEHQN